VSDSSKAVFLSYASQDKEVAQRICDALRAAGVEVWFDQSELRGGDAWDALIRKRIKECALFVPVITPTTNARAEGYFRLEWKLAVDRSHLMADDAPFLFPIVIGEVNDATARVPDKFRDVQWTRLRLDETPAELGMRVAKLLSGNGGSPVIATPGARSSQATTLQKPIRGQWWMIFPVIGTLMGLLFAAVPIWKATHGPTPQRTAPPAATPALVARGPAPASPSSMRPDEKSVAVLAFANLSDDKANEYFSDGISEELLNVLAKIPGLKVSARTSAFFFKGKEVPVPEIARQLGVAYVIEGSVRKAGDKVRITAELVKAADGFQVWRDTFTRDLKDIFAVQDEIAGLIAQNLQLKLQAGPRREVDPEAHRLVLEGRYYWNWRSEEGFTRAEAAFREAIALAPDFAAAHAGLADVLATRSGYHAYESIIDSTDEGRAEAERAIALDPAMAEAYPALGLLRAWDGHGAEAKQIFSKALALNPNYALPHHWLSLVFENEGRIDLALVAIGRAVELDPLSGIAIGTRGRMLMEAGRYAEGLTEYQRAAALLPDRPALEVGPALCLSRLGRSDEAVAHARKTLALQMRELRLTADAQAIHVLRQNGQEADARTQAARILPLFPAESYQRGAVLAALGRWSEAEPFLEHTPVQMQYVFYWDPVWDEVRDDPRFRQLMAKLGRAEDYRVARETFIRLQAERKNPP
jgi:TolB-like protein/Tfp pilus assembly protein PilF